MRVVVAYGSQTGCAQSIAQRVGDDLRSFLGADNVQVSTLNTWKQKLAEFAVIPYLVIICSTTGAGDFPDNAGRFYRIIKKRTMKPPIFAKLTFSVLALGDTNYDHFCQAGKRLHNRLKDLGGVPFVDIVCADDAVGIEEKVEPWCEKIVNALQKFYQNVKEVFKPTDETADDNHTDSNANAKKSISVGGASMSKIETPKKLLNDNTQSQNVQLSSKQSDSPQEQKINVDEDTIPTLSVSNLDGSQKMFTLSAAQQAIRARSLLGRGGSVNLARLNKIDKDAAQKEEQTQTSTTINPNAALPQQVSTSPLAETKKSIKDIENRILNQHITTTSNVQSFDEKSAVDESEDLPRLSSQSKRQISSFKPVRLAALFPDVFTDPNSAKHLLSGVRFPRLRPHKHTFNVQPASTRITSQRDSVYRLSKTRPINTLPADTLGATVVHATELTPSHGHDLESDYGRRTVLLVRMKLHENVQWMVGDAFGLYCENHSWEVEALMERLDIPKHLWDSEKTDFKPSLPHIYSKTSLRVLLTYCCSLRWIFQKAFLRHLAQYCEQENERNQLLVLASSRGRQFFDAFILRQQPSILELLKLFPSCKPPVSIILSFSTPLTPRYYSVASSPLLVDSQSTQSYSRGTSRIVEFAFSVVRYTIGTENFPVRREGLCTTWLESIALPFLSQDHTFHSREIRLVHRPGGDFRPPEDVERPLLMVGPGTGVAPFIGFLKYREAQIVIGTQARHDEESELGCEGYWRFDFECHTGEIGDEEAETTRLLKNFGTTHLYFGCRHRDQDFLFKDDLQHLKQNGTLTSLHTAFSRETACKVYVTHRLRQNSAIVAKLIREENAVIYVCGDGMHMAKDVEASILDILTNVHESGSSESSGDEPQMSRRQKAVAEVELLKKKKRYLQDIWS